ncbi:hypothetical protein V1478_010815 [Vespula squamosa]|uniref:Uncharacterized protein n=1 Tax=Vespula squamosa TaxID=30214 RepID=A0ABD2AFE9_VESSQ
MKTSKEKKKKKKKKRKRKMKKKKRKRKKRKKKKEENEEKTKERRKEEEEEREGHRKWRTEEEEGEGTCRRIEKVDRGCTEGTWAVPGGDYGNAGRRFGAVKIIRWCPSTATGPVYLRSLCAAIFGTAARQVFPPGPTSNYRGGRSEGLKGSRD